MARYFVIYIPDRSWQACLDVMRLLCNPSVHASAHLTVRGPYHEKPELDSAWYRFRNIQVSVIGVEKFFGPHQNTVSLKCELPDLKSIWWKKDYKNGIPHITIYDGDSRCFAEKVDLILSKYDWSFQFSAERLYEYIGSGKQSRFDFPWQEYAMVFSKTIGFSLTREELSQADECTRLQYLDAVARFLWTKVVQEQHAPA
jgi:hypothetical protein